MNNKKILYSIIILIVAIVLIIITIKTNNYQDSNLSKQYIETNTSMNLSKTNDGGAVINQSNNTLTGNIVTAQELAKHDNGDDCWVGYDGKVYDITNFLPQHPGTASRIIPFCGTEEEFTKNFQAQHGTSQVKRLIRVGVLMGDFKVEGMIG